MLGLILIPIMNVCLFLGMFKENENLLNIALFIMAFIAGLYFLAMFAKDEDLIKNKSSFFIIIVTRILVVISVTHSVYWGYIFLPAVWAISTLVLWARRRQINEKLKEEEV